MRILSIIACYCPRWWVTGTVTKVSHFFFDFTIKIVLPFSLRRYSPTQSPRLIPTTLPIGLPVSPSAGRPPVVVATPPIGVGPESPWVPRQQPVMPIAPPLPLPGASQRMPTTYPAPPPPLPGPSFSRRGRPPSDVNAPRQETSPTVPVTSASDVPAVVTVAEPRPVAPPAQNQVNCTSISPYLKNTQSWCRRQ